MSRGFVRAFIAVLCGTTDLSALTIPMRPFALHPYIPKGSTHNLRQSKRSLKSMPPSQRKMLQRSKKR